MKNILSHVVVGLLFLFVGTFYGYGRGVKNQMFYDAPAKLHLYNAYLEQGTAAKFLEGEIIYQLGLIEGMKNEVSPFLLSHPMHAGLRDLFEEYSPKVEALPQIKKARVKMNEASTSSRKEEGIVEAHISEHQDNQ